jgi:2-C-methyl-D-erythritol 2,4-cyclodiphosphate synthase
VHALVPGRPLVIGGVTIPHTMGLLGHSDADVLLHAITDALLGAAALGDIGTHFPDTDPVFRGADSACCWPRRRAGCAQAGWRHRQHRQHRRRAGAAPGAAPRAMRDAIARALGMEPGQVNVKAKTAEKLGPVGQGQSIEARAVVLMLSIA